MDELQRTERVLRETYGELDATLGGLGLAVGQLRDNVMKLRMVPIARLFTKYQRTVRELSHKLGKQVKVELVGADTELDKVLVERLEDPLLHLVRNAVDHGIEPPERRAGAGKPRAGRSGSGRRAPRRPNRGHDRRRRRGHGSGELAREGRRKGRALARGSCERSSESESLRADLPAGFSTAAQVSDVSGRGVGMDVVTRRDRAAQRLDPPRFDPGAWTRRSSSGCR